MSKRVLSLDKSYLASNVYYMVLSKLGEISLLSLQKREDAEKIAESEWDLIIMGHRIINEDRAEVLKLWDSNPAVLDTPKIVMIPAGLCDQWSDVVARRNTFLLERPFHPDDLLEVVRGLWKIA